MMFENENRTRYYGLRKGDIVTARTLAKQVYYKGAEVVGYSSDNNRVIINHPRLENPTWWVAEWCEITKKVEER